jgi:hypothetical protein
MVPSSYVSYFSAATTAAGTLIGLLFVAVALRPETVFGPDAPLAGRALAASAFTALVNAFIVSLCALTPHGNLGWAALAASVSALTSTIRLHRDLGDAHLRWTLMLVSLATYALEGVLAIILLARPHDGGVVGNLADITIVAFAVALARAWSLLRGAHLDRTK